MNSFHFRVTSCPSEAGARPAAGRGGVRLGSLVGLSGRGDKHLHFPQSGPVRWAGCAEGRGGLHVVAVVSLVTAAVGWWGRRAHRSRNGSGCIRFEFRFEFVGQDEFSEFGASGVTLGGDVHVGRVSTQQPGGQQREGYTASAAVDLRHTKTSEVNTQNIQNKSVQLVRRRAEDQVLPLQSHGMVYLNIERPTWTLHVNSQ